MYIYLAGVKEKNYCRLPSVGDICMGLRDVARGIARRIDVYSEYSKYGVYYSC